MTVSSMHLQLFLPLAPGCVSGRYEAAEDFLADVDLICRNALEYNPDTTEVGREIRHRACMLRDQVRHGQHTGQLVSALSGTLAFLLEVRLKGKGS